MWDLDNKIQLVSRLRKVPENWKFDIFWPYFKEIKSLLKPRDVFFPSFETYLVKNVFKCFCYRRSSVEFTKNKKKMFSDPKVNFLLHFHSVEIRVLVEKYDLSSVSYGLIRL